MTRTKKLAVWTLAVVIWFFIHTLLLLFVLTGSTNKLEGVESTSRDRPEVKRTGSSQQFVAQKHTEVEAATKHLKDLQFIPHLSPHRENLKSKPSKYAIHPKKITRLYSIMNDIKHRYKRPGEDYYGFNITRSEEIPIDRHIPDNRPKECRDINYDYDALPSVSVVTPVHNEALSTLVRHVVAILLRTPDHLLKDIIIVDDNSTFGYLGRNLENLFRVLDPRIKILRNTVREGLVKSRMYGAEVARGDVIVFLDAHMEAGPGWSEPLLARLNSQSSIVVQPDVPGIDSNTFDFETSEIAAFRGGFGWDMRYAWFFVPPYIHQMRSSEMLPIPAPVLTGCAIAVRKTYFNSIGQFDPGLKIWGGEHFDLSFRVWTSGGRVELIPCSKVGHVFKQNKYSYGPEGKHFVLSKNLLRVAEIWMDGYLDIVYAAAKGLNPDIPQFTTEELASIQQRRQLKMDLKCKSFTWYLQHVMPEVKVPSRDARWFGEVTNEKTKACFFVTSDEYIGVTSQCFQYRIIPENSFTIDKWGRMVYETKCVGLDRGSLMLKLMECPCVNNESSWPKWDIDVSGRLTYSGPWGSLCATHVTSVAHVHKGEQMVQALTCKTDSNYQAWKFMYHLVY